MRNWKKLAVSPKSSVRETIRVINEGSAQIALVIDRDDRLVGTVTDGDVRRGILKGHSLDSAVSRVMNSNPLTAPRDGDRHKVVAKMKSLLIRQMPIVDWRGRIVGFELVDNLSAPAKGNWVVLMAGGLGTRLRPFTSVFPKPLLPVGQKPLLETTIEMLAEHGLRKIFVAVNYKGRMIEQYFGDGSRLGVEITYLHETERMGTAGALSLLKPRPKEPLLVMNGDVLTKLNYRQLLDFHSEQKATATMCVREYELQIPYGVLDIDKGSIRKVTEKPVARYFINAGIYVLEPSVLKLMGTRARIDMTTLFDRVIRKRQRAAAFPIREYWLDIGHLSDFERASGEFEREFEE